MNQAAIVDSPVRMTRIGNCELHHIDCMEYMATLPDKAFDLAIVDPPYGIKQDGHRRHRLLNISWNSNA